MPRPRSTSTAELSGGQAQYVIGRLMKDRRVGSGEINRYLNEMQGEIQALEAQLEQLRNAIGGASAAPARRGPGRPSRAASAPAPARRGPGRPPKASNAAAAPAAAAAPVKRKRNISPERRRALKLQGSFLGLVRQMPASKRDLYSKMFKDKGPQAAISAMKKVLNK